jgi:hypothetical protein
VSFVVLCHSLFCWSESNTLPKSTSDEGLIFVRRLFGTIVLPVAVCLTYALIINTALQPPSNFQEAIPVILLVGVLGLPAILVLITTRRVVYVGWMVIYLLSLPVWNFVLPVYSFIKMDGKIPV